MNLKAIAAGLAAALTLAATASASARQHESVAVGIRVAVSHHHVQATVRRGDAVGHIVGGGLLSAAATYIGVDRTAIVADLKAGMSLARIATAHGKTADGLVAALLAPAKLRLDAAVAAGRITADREAAVVSRLQAVLKTLVNRSLPARTQARPVRLGPGAIIRPALTYLGLDWRTLVAQLRSGMTLADVANATPGKSEGGLVDAVVASVKTRLDARVAAGRITSAQEATFLAQLKSSVTALVNGSHRATRQG